MINNFKDFQAQIVPEPLGIEVVKAKGSYIYDKKKKYLDFVAGVSVCNLGHSDKRVIKATINQLKKYSHVMVYGEFALEPSINLCGLLVENLPKNLNPRWTKTTEKTIPDKMYSIEKFLYPK